MHKEAARQKRKDADDAIEAAFVESDKQRERDAYIRGNEVTMRTCGTKERKESNLARYEYGMEKEPI